MSLMKDGLFGFNYIARLKFAGFQFDPKSVKINKEVSIFVSNKLVCIHLQ